MSGCYLCPICHRTFDNPRILHYTQLGMVHDVDHHEMHCPECGAIILHENDLALFDIRMKDYEVRV